MKKQYSLKQIERLAKDKNICFINVVYDKEYYKSSVHLTHPHSYSYEDRDKIRWDHVVRCRLDWDKPKWHNVDGEAGPVPGFRIRPE